MKRYFILEETFRHEKAYLYNATVNKDIVRIISTGGTLNEKQSNNIVFTYKEKGLKDFMHSNIITVVSSKFINVLNKLSVTNYHTYPVTLLNISKTTSHTDYFLFIPEVVSFFDYKSSNYKGLEEEKYIGKISKMVVDDSKLGGRRICRFYELITKILIDDALENELQANNIKGLNYLTAEEFKFPYF